jgi:hypothetical protein
MGEQAEGRSLLVARHRLTGDLGASQQPGKHLAKLQVVGALAELPRLIDAAIKDHDVRVAAQQAVSRGRSKAKHDTPDGRHDLALCLAHGCGLCLDQAIPAPIPVPVMDTRGSAARVAASAADLASSWRRFIPHQTRRPRWGQSLNSS